MFCLLTKFFTISCACLTIFGSLTISSNPGEDEQNIQASSPLKNSHRRFKSSPTLDSSKLHNRTGSGNVIKDKKKPQPTKKRVKLQTLESSTSGITRSVTILLPEASQPKLLTQSISAEFIPKEEHGIVLAQPIIEDEKILLIKLNDSLKRIPKSLRKKVKLKLRRGPRLETDIKLLKVNFSKTVLQINSRDTLINLSEAFQFGFLRFRVLLCQKNKEIKVSNPIGGFKIAFYFWPFCRFAQFKYDLELLDIKLDHISYLNLIIIFDELGTTKITGNHFIQLLANLAKDYPQAHNFVKEYIEFWIYFVQIQIKSTRIHGNIFLETRDASCMINKSLYSLIYEQLNNLLLQLN
jgi:hypothetical protein